MSIIVASPTLDVIVDQLEVRKAETFSPFKKRAISIRQALFRLLGADGFGMNNRGRGVGKKGKFILYTSNALSGVATIGLTALTLGYHGYVQYKGSKLDQNKVQDFRPVHVSG